MGNNPFDEDKDPKVSTPESIEAMFSPEAGNTLGSIVAARQTIEQIKSKYYTAVRVQVPRDLEKIKEVCMQEARFGGDTFGWAWPVEVPDKDEKGFIKKNDDGSWKMKKEIVDGKSIGLANAAIRNWTNCTSELYIVNDTPTHAELLGVFIDYEKGYTDMRPYIIRYASRDLSKKQKEKASQVERQRDMTLQIGLSKCKRNLILGCLPSWLTEAMYEESKKYAIKRIEENLEESKRKCLFAFSKYGVMQEHLEASAEVPAAEWKGEHLVNLRGLLQLLKDGTETVATLFPGVIIPQQSEQSSEPSSPAVENKTEASEQPTQLFPKVTQERKNGVIFIDKVLGAIKEKNDKFVILDWLLKNSNGAVDNIDALHTLDEGIFQNLLTAAGGEASERGITISTEPQKPSKVKI